MSRPVTKSEKLSAMSCTSCRKGDPALMGNDLGEFACKLPEWAVVEEHHIERTYAFPDFKKALSFTWEVGQAAETEVHHPEIRLSWGRVTVQIYTHKVDGLTENDFILAAKCDGIYEKLRV